MFPKTSLFFAALSLLSFTNAAVLITRQELNAVLNEHNTFRAQHGAAPLAWSNNLAKAAQNWGSRCEFKHSGGAVGPFGENLAAGAGGGYKPVDGVKQWNAEVKDYDPKNPQFSHFTQVVWKATKEVGCAAVQCGDKIFGPDFKDSTYLVCEYSPPGNVIGQFAENVQK
ncbi:hypothetical protein AAF712_014907 [Marasmius tenuissimus]|uniref:SCP domain-containing protein n=1 Tax=Marasmius tenuissimus TaxID=585030 RepID=A0ABR2Z9Q3_9AGAR|nr:hypothetical protein PM082_011355 [Marasmius tenuissimus]